MFHDISIKEFRAQLAKIADRVENGEVFRIIRHSKPVFIVMKMDDESDAEQWKTVIDFTEGGTTKGAAISDVLKGFKELKEEDG